MDLFAKILTIFSRYLLWSKDTSKMLDSVLNTPLEYAHFHYIIQDQFVAVYGLMAFTEDLNEYQNLEKLVYC